MIRKRLRAVDGLIERFEYLARVNPGAAERFVDAVEQTLKTLEQMPRLGREWGVRGSVLADVRVRAVIGLENYLLYYRPIRGGIEWFAVRHAAQGDEDVAGEIEP